MKLQRKKHIPQIPSIILTLRSAVTWRRSYVMVREQEKVRESPGEIGPSSSPSREWASQAGTETH